LRFNVHLDFGSPARLRFLVAKASVGWTLPQGVIMTMACGSWYYDRQHTTQGPISTATLQEMVDDGRIGPNQVVWEQSMDSRRYVRADRVILAGRFEANAL
jgi:hypothetical protein